MDVSNIIEFNSLHTRWDALVALIVGFLAAIPFMNTSLLVGVVTSRWLHGGDLAFPVGFVVGGAVYALLRYAATKSSRDTNAVAT
jgi:NCS1 family nucleobase:cation symporter-1